MGEVPADLFFETRCFACGAHEVNCVVNPLGEVLPLCAIPNEWEGQCDRCGEQSLVPHWRW